MDAHISSSDSPFRIMDLPDELFINVLQISFGKRPPPLLHKRRRKGSNNVYWILGAPATYALVCRSWRKLVYSTPRLWASVTVNASHLRLGDTAVRIFVNWLTRAKSHPLTIELNFEAVNSAGPYKSLDTLLAFIEMLYSKYVWKLSITLPSQGSSFQIDLPHRRLSAIFQDAPWLAIFTLVIPHKTGSLAFLPSTLYVDSGAPNLRVIRLSMWSSLLRIRSPQTSLTKLVISERVHSIREVFNILQNTPLLEVFQTTISCREYINPRSVTLARLRELSIAFYHTHEDSEKGICLTADHFFLSIRTPSLSKLAVSAPRTRFQWGTILNFMSNSSQPPIVKFIANKIDIEVWRLQFALSLMSKLEVLTLACLKGMDGISKALKIYRSPDAPCPPCPNLQELRIVIPKGTEYDAEELVYMVFSRCRGYYKDRTVADGDTLHSFSPRSIVISNVGTLEKEKLTVLIGDKTYTGCSNYTCEAVGRNGDTLVIEKKSQVPPRRREDSI